jgi:2-keto-4-pentenoate hydratase
VTVTDAVAAGMRAQLERRRARLRDGDGRLGWKIGLNDPKVMERLGLERPVVGHLLASARHDPGEALSLAGTTSPAIEPEVAIHLDDDGQVAGVGPALELIDAAPPFEDLEAIIAGNIFHRAVVLGPTAPLELLPKRVTVARNGAEELAAEVAVDVAGTVALVAERLDAAGERLEAGDRIIAGSLTPAVPVAAGDHLIADFGELGALEIRFTD